MRIVPPTVRGFLLATCLFAPAAFLGRSAETTTLEIRGVALEKTIRVSCSPVEAYDAFTGDLESWWDHTFSEDPAQFRIEAKPGGGFWEIFDAEGDGILHARVTWAERGKKLVFRGPLGFHGMAVDFVHTIEFGADAEGTTVMERGRGLGELDESSADALDRVWDHFLARFQAHVSG